MSKRIQPNDPDLLKFELEGLLHGLRQQEGGDDMVAAAILSMADRAGLMLEELEKYEAATPSESFSNTSWEDIASKIDMSPSGGLHQLPFFSFPVASLPPSFHREVMKSSDKWLDVYRECGAPDSEPARMRLMDAWHIPVCALFKGRLVDKPKSLMPMTPENETSRGEVEHEVFMRQGTIMLIFQLKLEVKSMRDHVAQVLLELVSYKQNSKEGFKPQPSVYAILTDLEKFSFYRYDGSQFARTKSMFVSSESRLKFLAGITQVSEQLFSVLLGGYIDILTAMEDQSTRQGIVGDRTRHSLGNWSQALGKACEAQQILVNCKKESLQSWEEDGCHGLICLNESLLFLSKIGSNTDWDEVTLENEIEKVLTMIKKPSSSSY